MIVVLATAFSFLACACASPIPESVIAASSAARTRKRTFFMTFLHVGDSPLRGDRRLATIIGCNGCRDINEIGQTRFCRGSGRSSTPSTLPYAARHKYRQVSEYGPDARRAPLRWVESDSRPGHALEQTDRPT